MVYNSLTDAPHNVKECVDWLIALRGAHPDNNLKAMGVALYDFLVDKPVGKMEVPALENVKKISKEFMEQKELKNMWPANELLKRFSKPMIKNNYKLRNIFTTIYDSDYKNVVNSKDATAETVITGVINLTYGCERFLNHMKVPEQYKSAYSSEATWESSCSKKPEDCAVVLVGIAPMLYTGMLSLFDASNPPIVRCRANTVSERLKRVLTALGYVEPESRNSLHRAYVRKALVNVNFELLDTVYDFAGFWAFY
ncbi:hypothetical protein BBBOND_0109600 [Babesia bigemina]|uniref:Uncharacterized protein n=1 Tax=Babesia bigemina TaxID=5866 RepID=A0A061D3K9_BABBI|nr:hypothetical protein BBBOND_0109600 [Babesia bigemina]CDR94662.1 hypothetical protein BBBOND_0109600 [Babesia bigemina]|eukprot:XP_012766848.1 hypothetical protein BBBOND_0109600 [Babesia bigemina]